LGDLGLIAAQAILSAINTADAVVDEIGSIELLSEKFKSCHDESAEKRQARL